MQERLALAFDDQSLLVFPEGTDMQAALREAAEHDYGDASERKTRVVRVSIIVKEAATAVP